MGTLFSVLLFPLMLAAAVLLLIFVMVPLFKGIGWAIGGFFGAIGWVLTHIFEFIGGMISDTLRFVGAIIAMVVLAPFAFVNVIIGRWSAAGHFAESVKRECKVAAMCLYRVVLRRPLKFVLLHGLLEGIEQRVPEAMAAAPTSDRPGRLGQFPGYEIVGSLRGGGSGGKLFIAQPDETMRARNPQMPERVVIKAFALSEGSSLPQIVRESRALESARQLGLVFDHHMDEHRFYYVMRYHPGDHLGIVTRQLHGETDGQGLGQKQLAIGLSYMGDLVGTLAAYHRGGLWHKDVKPENVIVHDGRAHLVDLGLVTPLRSAMTLTTHGTEYFRDPEMVRQALRGVKVHQVNGAKFDIFAAGAVLYFLIENTFPPHGALSRFSRKSPDALRWIVRRAMADYSHRYESSDEMMADLAHVAAAADPFAVKPANLPSLHGRDVDALDIDADDARVETVAHASTPVPPAGHVATPEGPWPPTVAAAADATAGNRGEEQRLPQLEVTNWWTGAYRVLDPGSAGVATPPGFQAFAQHQARVAREQATALRHDAAELRHRVRTGAITARKAARAQVHAARTRAGEIRRRAREHRHRAVAERQPSPTLVAIGLLAVIFIGIFLVIGYLSSGRRSGRPIVLRDAGARVLLLADVADLDQSDQRAFDRIVDRREREGYDVIVGHDARMVDRMTHMVGLWRVDEDPVLGEEIEDELEQYGLYGILFIRRYEDGRLKGRLFNSERPGAAARRHTVVAQPPAAPYLLVNDHPTRNAPDVADRIDDLLRQYELRGWTVLVDDELEARVRQSLPPGPIEIDTAISHMLNRVLDEAKLGGILHVHAGPGDGPAGDRIVLTPLEAKPVDRSSGTAEVEEASEITIWEGDGDEVSSVALVTAFAA